MPLHFELVTPERILFNQEVDEVSLPTTEGEITVLPNHIPMVATLVPGIARTRAGANEEEVAVSGGFIEIQAGSKIRVLADTAERGHELSLTTIEEAKKRAEDVMKNLVHADDEGYAAAAAALERELARYRVAQKHRRSAHVPTYDAANLPHDENPV